MIDASSAYNLATEFDASAARLPVDVATKMAHFGGLLHMAIVARAPGTDYPTTIRPEVFAAGPIVGVAVGTDRPDGFRREIGFHGKDRLGRTYSEAGHPHFAPGFDAVAPDFEASMDRSLTGE